MASYREQAFKILDESRTEVRYNSEWLGRLDFAAPGPMDPPEQADRPEIWRACQRAFYVGSMTRVKNRIKALLSQQSEEK